MTINPIYDQSFRVVEGARPTFILVTNWIFKDTVNCLMFLGTTSILSHNDTAIWRIKYKK